MFDYIDKLGFGIEVSYDKTLDSTPEDNIFKLDFNSLSYILKNILFPKYLLSLRISNSTIG
jgi:hypothetical protein